MKLNYCFMSLSTTLHSIQKYSLKIVNGPPSDRFEVYPVPVKLKLGWR